MASSIFAAHWLLSFQSAVKKIILLCLGIVALGACDKNSEPAPAPPSPTDLLTAKNWRLTTATVTLAGIPVPVPGLVGACSLDDYLKFNTNKTVVHDEGATKCDPTDPQTDNGTWSMPSADKLTITLPNSSLPSGTFDVKELSATTLHLYISSSQGGIPGTADLTLTAF
jgi:hypothetical protein